MTSNRNRLGGFEEKLLGELKSVVAQRKAEQSALRPARPPLWRRPRVVSVASAGALAIGVAVGVPFLGGQNTAPSASAAYSVTTNEDGTVTVAIHRWGDAEGLEEQLEAHGVPAEVDYPPEGKRCQLHRGRQSTERADIVSSVFPGPGLGEYRLTIRPSEIGPNETLVIVNTAVDRVIDGDDNVGDAMSLTTGAQVIAGPVAPCVLEDVPPDELY
jgi:hypothetical protein